MTAKQKNITIVIMINVCVAKSWSLKFLFLPLIFCTFVLFTSKSALIIINFESLQQNKERTAILVKYEIKETLKFQSVVKYT